MLRWLGAGLLFLAVLLCLAVTIVPAFLDRVYYRGPASAHFDAARFFNPDGDADTFRMPGNRSRSGFLVRYLTGNDDRPRWPAQVAVTPARPPARVAGDRMVATWIGHATVLVQTRGLNILTDPVWSEHAGPFGIGPGRVAPPGVRFEDLPKIDVVLVSHDHYDHMDLSTLKQLWARDRPRIVTSLGNDTILRSAGIEAIAADWGGRVKIGRDATVVVTRNHHWGSRWFADRNRALWSSFTVQLPGGNLFFAGDTGMGDGEWPVEAARLGPVRLALLPIGAFRFGEGQMGAGSHIGPVDAVEVYRRLQAHSAIAIHWGTFRLSYEGYNTPPRLLEAAMACTGQRGFAGVPIGRPVTIPRYATPFSSPPVTRDALLRCLDTPAVRALR
ncbi:Zn-dependent hydrolase [Sphingomonas aracearum]|uniref:Zn-dependent hydrolase n=2 Tax=Sphingomonas aracearum TaxID=2283317 RepID=A0A369W2D0_9SPHN|nr:MBL fold metallo-hydrolase [Sphingomonas aracearum]RDE07520.1 Zn-dependent hydrolase [Sphingomonas aracearum]